MGAEMMRLALVLAAVFAGVTPSVALAQQRFAVIVSGATGGEEYLTQYAVWTDMLHRTLVERMKFDPQRIRVLVESDTAETASTAGNVRRAIASVRQQMARNDLLFVLLVGPDLEASEWAALLEPLPGNVVVVNTTAGSFPFIERLSGAKRVVITATDSVAQRFDTIFAEYFVRAFEDESADLDKNARVSIWEAFASAAAGVRRHYQQRGQLSTERSLLDDNGDGVGTSAAEQGADGAQASRIYLEAEQPGALPTDEELLKLLQRKALLEGELEELKIRRAFLSAEEYAKEFERIISDYARVSSEIRRRRE